MGNIFKRSGDAEQIAFPRSHRRMLMVMLKIGSLAEAYTF